MLNQDEMLPETLDGSVCAQHLPTLSTKSAPGTSLLSTKPLRQSEYPGFDPLINIESADTEELVVSTAFVVLLMIKAQISSAT